MPIDEPAGDGQAATCGAGTVMGLKKGGDGFLAVRTGPGANGRTIRERHNGKRASFIDGRDGWHGVIVPGGSVDRVDACRRVGSKPSGSDLGRVSGRWIGDIYP